MSTKETEDSFDTAFTAYQESVTAPLTESNDDAAAREDGEDDETDVNATRYAVLKVCLLSQVRQRLD